VHAKQAEELAAELAHHRHNKDASERIKCRKKAAAWQKAHDRREREWIVKHQQLQRLAEQARRASDIQEASNHGVRTNAAFDRIMERQKVANSCEDAEDSPKVLDTGVRPQQQMTQLDHKINMMRKAEKLRKRAERRARKREDRKLSFLKLPEEERQHFESIFARFDKQGRGVLELSELRDALWEYGLRGVDFEERRISHRICEAAAAAHQKSIMADKEEEECDMSENLVCDMYEFTMEVVPAVRQHFMKLREETMLQHFNTRDSTGQGKIKVEQVLEVARTFSHADIDKRALDQARDDLRHANLADIGGDNSLLDFRQFALLVSRLAERNQRSTCLEKRRIQRERSLDEKTWNEFRNELIPLNRIFTRVDSDMSGYLDTRECLQLFKELGMVPKSAEDRLQITKLIEKHEEVSFSHFLRLVHDARHILELRGEQQLQKAFSKYADSNDASVIPTAGVSRVLEENGVSPKTSKEQDVVRLVIHEADPDGAGFFDLATVARIRQRAKEQLHQIHLQAEDEIAQQCGFSKAEVGEFRWAFEELDDDGSGLLELQELKGALAMLGKSSISDDQFEQAMEILDEDGSGALEFTEFLSLMKMLRDEEGIFSVEQTQLSSMDKINRKGLLMILEGFRFQHESLEDITDEGLLARACVLLEVDDASKPIQSFMPEVASFPELVEHSQKLREARGGIPSDMVKQLAELDKERVARVV